jgi:hypothetical protein
MFISKRKSTMKIADGNRHMCGMNINMGNVNYQRWSSPNGNRRNVGGMLFVHEGYTKVVCLTLPWRNHVLFNTFPKIYTKIVNPPSPSRENGGRGEWKSLETWDKFRILHICITEHEDVLRHGNRTVISNSVKGTKVITQ